MKIYTLGKVRFIYNDNYGLYQSTQYGNFFVSEEQLIAMGATTAEKSTDEIELPKMNYFEGLRDEDAYKWMKEITEVVNQIKRDK